MSTVPEVIALRHMGVRVGALSCITNLAAGMSTRKLRHEEVEAAAAARAGEMTSLLGHWIARVGALA
jgi:purine-nucleoside phosphorylase